MCSILCELWPNSPTYLKDCAIFFMQLSHVYKIIFIPHFMQQPTDNKLYFHYHSTHSWIQKRSIPYGLLIRCRRICCEDRFFQQEARLIKQKLLNGKYPPNFKGKYNTLSKINRIDLLRNNGKGEREKTRLITSYNAYNPNYNKTLHEYDGLLLMTKKEAIKSEDIQVTYSRSTN